MPDSADGEAGQQFRFRLKVAKTSCTGGEQGSGKFVALKLGRPIQPADAVVLGKANLPTDITDW